MLFDLIMKTKTELVLVHCLKSTNRRTGFVQSHEFKQTVIALQYYKYEYDTYANVL